MEIQHLLHRAADVGYYFDVRSTAVFFGIVMVALALQCFSGCNKQSNAPATVSQPQLTSSASPSSSSASFTGHPWPTVGQNNQRTSCSPLPGPENPELKWSVQLTGVNGDFSYGLDRGVLVGEGNSSYVAVALTVINAHDADGVFLWSRKTARSYHQPNITSDGNLLFAKNKVVILNKSSGASKTMYDIGSGIPLINSIETLISIPISVNDDLMLFAMEVSTGSIVQNLNSHQIQMIAIDGNCNSLFSTDIPEFPLEHIATAVDGTIFIPGINQLTALDQYGQIQWIYTIPGTGMNTRPLVTQSSGLIVYDRMRPVQALDMSGKLKWKIDYSPLRVYHLSADHQDNLIVFAGTKLGNPPVFSRVIIKLNPQGKEIWRKKFSSQSALSLSVDANDSIYYCSNRGVYSLSSDGTERWFLDLPDCTGQVAIGEDNKLFVLARGGMLHCIGEAE